MTSYLYLFLVLFGGEEQEVLEIRAKTQCNQCWSFEGYFLCKTSPENPPVNLFNRPSSGRFALCYKGYRRNSFYLLAEEEQDLCRGL